MDAISCDIIGYFFSCLPFRMVHIMYVDQYRCVFGKPMQNLNQSINGPKSDPDSNSVSDTILE